MHIDLHRRTPLLYFILFSLLTPSKIESQVNYEDGGLTGQQKLLLNPAFCVSSDGLNIQTLGSVITGPYLNQSSFYFGACYRINRLGTGFSINNFLYGPVTVNRSDLSFGSRFRINSKLTIVPSLQVSYLKSKLATGWISELNSNNNYQNLNISSGVIFDIKKRITFGASFYNLNSTDPIFGTSQTRQPIQIYHLSLLLFSERTITLQPYSVFKQNLISQIFELGTITYFNIFSLQTAFKKINSNNQFNAGLSLHLKKLKFGYSISFYPTAKINSNLHEIFLSFDLLNKSNAPQRNLTIN